VDDASDTLVSPAVSATPAFSAPRWNGWVLLLISLVGIFAFFATQTVAFAFVFIKAHPDIFRVSHVPREWVSQTAIINLISAKNLWLTTVASEVVLVALTIVLARAAFGATGRALGLGAAPSVGRVLYGVLAGVALVVLSSLVEEVQNLIFGAHPAQFPAQGLLTHHGLVDFALDFSSVSIAAPFAEELFFRGLIFGGLVQRMTPLYAALISAALFAGAHLEKWSFLPICAIGLGLAYIYYSTRSLWVNMVAHATVNGISLIIAYLFPQLVK
jgi:membrane protease YdiL (CAAX protease family)